MRMAFLVAQLWNINVPSSDHRLSLHDVLGWFDHEMLGKRLDAPENVTPEQMARIGQGGR